MLKSLGLRAQLVLVVALALAPVAVLALFDGLDQPVALVLALLLGMAGALWSGHAPDCATGGQPVAHGAASRVRRPGGAR
jgi:nitrate/nitrite transporter NarK